MKPLGTLHPTEWGPLAPASVHNFVTTAGSSAYAQDWGAAPGATGSSNPRYVEIASEVRGYVSLNSTSVIVPTSNMTSGTSGFEQFLPNVPYRRMVPGGSTGYSIATLSSGIVTVSQWAA
jgi:hypothetical protein